MLVHVALTQKCAPRVISRCQSLTGFVRGPRKKWKKSEGAQELSESSAVRARIQSRTSHATCKWRLVRRGADDAKRSDSLDVRSRQRVACRCPASFKFRM